MGVTARVGFCAAAALIAAGMFCWSTAAGLIAAGVLLGVLVALFTIEV